MMVLSSEQRKEDKLGRAPRRDGGHGRESKRELTR